jgi:hypothetical protein
MPDTPPTSEGLDLTAIKDAVAAATPMKWMGRPDGDVMTEAVTSIGDGYQPLPMLIATLGNRDDDWTADAHLIGHAPEWLTLLCDEVERLRRMQEACRHAKQTLADGVLTCILCHATEADPFRRSALATLTDSREGET